MRLIKFGVFFSLLLSLGFAPFDASAKSVTAIALFDGRAMISVDGARAKIVKEGATHKGVKVISANTKEAVIEVSGKRKTLKLNGTAVLSSELGSYDKNTPKVVELRENQHGFFETRGQINGRGIKFLVDTGANIVVLSSQQARSVGLEYLDGNRTWASTASGRAPMYTVIADTISIGPINLKNIEVGVIEGSFPEMPLLGMTFLRKVNMTRNGRLMTLEER